MLQFEDTDWTNIVTPIKVKQLKLLLLSLGYDKKLSKQLIEGFANGFDIWYRGSYRRKNLSNNLPFRVGSKLELWNKVMKEVKAGRYAGPFSKPPSEYFVQSPLGLVPKANDKTHLIFHLSYDFNQKDRSINHFTPAHLCSVKYNDLDHAIRSCLDLLRQAGIEQGIIFYGKTNCSNAFRLVPVLVSQCILLTMMAEHLTMGVRAFFVDKCLPFGSSRSCAIFQQFSDALAFIAKVKMIRDNIVDNPMLMNYLDDFLFIALSVMICDQMMGAFMQICNQIGCPISEEKTENASPIMIFLGMLLNGRFLVLSIPQEKVNKALGLLKSAIQDKKVTIKFIQH